MKNRFKLRTTLAAVGLSVGLAAATLISPNGALAQEPFLGETRAFGFNFCPRGWAPANGALLPINQNQSLYSLMGTMYGGDGRTTFALPDYRGRAPVSFGNGPGLNPLQQGQRVGSEYTTLTVAELPAHTHGVRAVSTTGDRGRPNSDFPATNSGTMYGPGPADGQMDAGVVTMTGGGQPFYRMPPFLAVNWCVATQGLFPSRN